MVVLGHSEGSSVTMMAATMAVFFLQMLTDLVVVVLCWEGANCPVRHSQIDVITSCSYHQLMSLPISIHRDTTRLDLSHNQLTSLQDLSSVHLLKLRHLDMSHNSIQELGQQALNGLTTLHSVDLSHNQLTVISDRAFVHLTALTSLKLNHNSLNDTVSAEVFLGLSHLSHLDLSYNQLHVLHNATFSHLPQLNWLSLRSNHLHKLQVGAMLSLHNLTYLDLTFNQLQMTSQSLPPGVFSPLSTLHSLRLDHNDDRYDRQYPPDVFNDLVSLRYLAPDTFSTVHFGPDFAALNHIETLDLGYNCKIVHLTNDSFTGFKFSSLRNMLVSGCWYLVTIDLCAFCHLPNLKTLRITSAYHISLATLLASLYGLQGQNMSEIDFSFSGSYQTRFFELDKEKARYLSNICVSNFSLQQTRLAALSSDCVPVRSSLFSKCIENIDLSQNSLLGKVQFLLKVLISFRQLRTIQLQNQKKFSIEKASCILADNCQYHMVGSPTIFTPNDTTVYVSVPPELVELNVSAFFSHITPLPPYIHFHPGRNLRALDLSYNGMNGCVTTFLGLDHLVTLKMNFNYCHNLSHTIFDHLHSLQHLELSNFGPRTSFYVSQGKRLFHNLTQLETLDLSFNDLHRLDPTMLERQPRLTSLDLSRNRFQFVPVHLGYHSNLTLLDLSHNIIASLTGSERDLLDGMATRHDIR